MDIFEIFRYDFIARAFEAGILLSLIAPLIGIFLVVRHYALLAEALAHVSLLGVAIAVFFGLPIFLGAVATSLVAALGIEKMRSTGRVFGDALIALFLATSLALSVVLMSMAGGLNANILSYLFGSLTTVSGANVAMLAILSVIIIGFFFVFYRPLFLLSLDEDLAQVSGVNVRSLNAAFIALAAITIAAAMQMVGALLIGALMVVPVLASMQLRRSFQATLYWSIFFSFFSVVLGFLLSYFYNVASGGSIVLVAVFFFILTYSIKRFLLR